MKKTSSFNLCAKAGIEFHSISYLVEIFPSPIPNIINDTEMETAADLIRMSGHLGYSEFSVPYTEFVTGDSGGKEHKFSRFDFLKWQLMRFPEDTLFQLINKTDCGIAELLDEDAEYEKNSEYDPEGWLSPYNDESESYKKGVEFIARLRSEFPKEFYEKLIESIIDPNIGVLTHFETEINDNINDIRGLYNHWNVPLMIVTYGNFYPYINIENNSNLMMDQYKIREMWVRNYDEGEIED